MKNIITSALMANSLAAMGADMSNGADNFYRGDKVDRVPFEKLTDFFTNNLR